MPFHGPCSARFVSLLYVILYSLFTAGVYPSGRMLLFPSSTYSLSYYYFDFFSPTLDECVQACSNDMYCLQLQWTYPTTCLLYGNSGNSAPSGSSQTSYAGQKISSGALSTPLSIGGPNAFSSASSKSYIIFQPTVIYNSQVTLVWHANQIGQIELVDPVQILMDTNSKCIAASFSASFSFQIIQPSGESGDGFAFYLSSDYFFSNQQNGEYLGFPRNGGIGFAIEFDTSQSTDLGDIDYSHVGVDLGFNASSVYQKSTLPLGIKLNSSSVKTAWVDYDGGSLTLSVFLTVGKTKPSKPLLQYGINLCSLFRPLTCPDCAQRNAFYFGFIGSNGGYFESVGGNQGVTILSWSLNTFWPAKPALTSPGGQCVTASLSYSSTQYSSSFSLSPSSCCSKCSSSQNCLAYSWQSSSSICYLSYSPFGGSIDDTFSGGYLPIAPLNYPLSLSIAGFTQTSRMFLQGSASVQDPTLILSYTNNQFGYATLSQPVQILSNNNGQCSAYTLSAYFSFNMYGGDPTAGLGSGFTFFIIAGVAYRDRLTSSNDADLGLNYNNDNSPPGIIAVEFDPHNDSLVNDPLEPHVGINVGYGGYSAVTAKVADFGMSLTDGVVKYAWIDYDSRFGILSLYMSYLNLKPNSPFIEYELDLCTMMRTRIDTTDLLTAYVGFSAKTTYSNYEIVEISSFSVNSVLNAPVNLWSGPRQFGFVPPSVVSPKENAFFRYFSAGYISQTGIQRSPSWRVATGWNWADNGLAPPLDQGECGSCYVFSGVGAAESAYYLSHYNPGSSVPSLSRQQVLSCSGQGKCGGGSPTDVLSYIIYNGLVPSKSFPYTGKNSTQCSIPKGPKYAISSFESVNYLDWLGLLLAVNQQPIIVSVEGSSPSFIVYKSGIFDDDSCYSNGVDHNVLLVGYNIVSNPPYWIIQNSWGTSWGESGYMRMAIATGNGICGINTGPAYIPIPTFSDPCNTNSNPYLTNVKDPNTAPGRMNPCGGGTCTVVGKSNKCSCPGDFAAVGNSDGSQTCAPVDACSFLTKNPCNVGSCVSSISTPGSYTCICPLGYEQATYAGDGKPTCAPAAEVGGIQLYTLPAGFSTTCGVVLQTYGIPQATFLRQNKALGLNCNKALTGGTKVNVTNDAINGCSLPYSVNKGDTCNSISFLFNIRSLNGPGSPNPDLDCSTLQASQMVCIVRATANSLSLAIPLCTKFYAVQPKDTCQSIISSQFSGSAVQFFTMNPGLSCINFNAVVALSSHLGQQICLAATSFGTIKQGCKGKVVVPRVGESCFSIFTTYYCSQRRVFRLYNKNWDCQGDRLFVGSKSVTGRIALCAPLVC